MNVFADCERTSEGRIAIDAAIKAVSEVRDSVIPGFADDLFLRETLLPYIYQAVLESAMKRESDRFEQDRLKEEWWKMQGVIGQRKARKFLDGRYGKMPP